MSMFSAFGFSGYDPIGSAMENTDNTMWGQMNNTFNGMRDWYYAKKASARQAALQWEYQKKAALEMPTLQRQGLLAAGFNPLLAIANGIHSPSSMSVSASSPISGGSVPSAPNGSAGFDAQQFFSAKSFKKLTDATVKTAEANADKASNEAAEVAARTDKIKDETGSKTWLGKLFSDIQAWTKKVDNWTRENSSSAKQGVENVKDAESRVKKAEEVMRGSSKNSNSSPAFKMDIKRKGGMTYDSYRMPSMLKALGY